MLIKKSYLVTLFLAFFVQTSKGQNSVISSNMKYIDSVENQMRVFFCNNVIEYQEKYQNKLLVPDLKMAEFLNFYFIKSNSVSEINRELKKLKKIKVYVDSTKNGLISIVKVILNGNYVRVELKAEAISNSIYNKKMEFYTNKDARCGDMKIRIFDFKLFRNSFIPKLNFSIEFFNRSAKKSVFLLNNLNLAAKNNSSYNFNLPDPSFPLWINNILSKQYYGDSVCCYSYSKGENDFRVLIKSGNTEVIKKLLFSPNYLFSINAMEALIYLKSKNNIILEEEIEKQINYIIEANYPINVQNGIDVFSVVNGYKNINISKSAVIKKYE